MSAQWATVLAVGAGTVVLKAVGELHKSDSGGVVVGIRDEEALLAAVAGMASQELSVERMEDLAAGFELLIGARRDARFGPIVVATLK